MKAILTTMMLVWCVTMSAQEFVVPSKTKVVFTDTTTTFTYKMPERTYKVYKTKNGAFYIWKVSKKTGKEYRYYLPKEIQIQMGRKY